MIYQFDIILSFQMQWLDAMGRVITEGIKYTTELLEDGHRYNAKSALSFIATREHHHAVLTCTASNPALSQPLSTQVSLISYIIWLVIWGQDAILRSN